MKNITFLIFTIVGLGLLFSCEKKEADPIFDISKSSPATLSAPENGSILVLTEDFADSSIVFSWSAASYNLTDLGSTKYSLQIDLADSSFKHAKELTNTNDLSFTMTYEALNNVLLAFGILPDSTNGIEVRVIAKIITTSDYTNVTSAITSMTVTPYEASVVGEYPKLYVPGDYQGWAPADAPNVFDFDNDGVYNGYVFFPEGGTYEFKFATQPNWDGPNYGAGATAGTLDIDAGAGNLSVPGPGGYHLEIDINALTWSHSEVENWGVIGEWLAWAEDIDLIYDPMEQHLSVTVEGIPPAENQRFKFRANNAWDLNLGANDPDDGFLTQGGADIPIPDGGTITFILKFTTPEPSYEWYAN
ncbi:MAG: SusE domain-containing protein [Bacteroidales bacterium]|nr:SusE domain-containing protein [Bacteroidales bacterium]